MSPEVVRQMAVRRESPPAVVKRAGERLLPIVDASVSFQVSFFCELFTATFVVAYKRLFSHVGPFVDLKSTSTRVAFAADVAGKGLITRMDQLMGFQVAFCDELFTAVVKLAGKGTFSSMDAEMSFEVARLLEFSQAVGKGTEQGHLCASGPRSLLKTFFD